MKKHVLYHFQFCVHRKRKLRTEQTIVLMFLFLVLIGTCLLTLPLASRSRTSCGFMMALFTATSATCVTGLTLADTYAQWSLFGHLVILVLIQIGGLGFMAIVSSFFFLFHRKIGLRHRLIMAQSYALNELDGVVRLIRDVLRWTLLIEGCGALVLTLCFIGEFGFLRAVWWGIFHSVSAFCNAGFDLFGEFAENSSLKLFADDCIIMCALMLLAVIGGLGFYVWADIARKKCFRRLSLHSKLALLTSACLTLGGALLFFLMERNNPQTIADLSLGKKIQLMLFQSVTCRTVGFTAFEQAALTDSSKIISAALMLIGGSPGSTAGGIKTVTIALLLLAAVATARGKRHISFLGRTISDHQIRQAISVFFLMSSLAFASALFISCTDGAPFVNAIFETTAALGTTGMTAGITAELCVLSQFLLILLMFFGRVGIMTISLSFLSTVSAEERIRYAEAKVLIG